MNMEEIQFRPMTEADLPRVAAIEEISIQDGWTLNSFAEAMNNPQALMLVAAAQVDVAGYVVMYHAADEGEIPTIAVAPDFRRRGIAAAMLKEAMRQGYDLGVRNIYLEVRESNLPAQKSYESSGFTNAGKRKNFYENPHEDAYVMTCSLEN